MFIFLHPNRLEALTVIVCLGMLFIRISKKMFLISWLSQLKFNAY